MTKNTQTQRTSTDLYIGIIVDRNGCIKPVSVAKTKKRAGMLLDQYIKERDGSIGNLKPYGVIGVSRDLVDI